MTIEYKEFMDRKYKFMKRHNNDWKVDTSSMDSYGVYYKTYVFADGAVWYERYCPVWRTAESVVEIELGCKVTMKQDIKLFETESWNSDGIETIKMYEPF